MKPSKMTLATTFVTLAALGVFASACSSSSKTASPDATTATTTTVPAPAAVTVTATDYAFSGVPATLEAGLINFKFVNKGTVNHELAFLKVTNNTDTEAAFTSLGKIFNGEPFPASFLGANGVHDTEAGTTSEAQLNLTPGQYIALCSDSGIAGTKKDGKPHFSRGMFKKLTVTGTGGDTPPAVGSVLTAHDYSFDIEPAEGRAADHLVCEQGPDAVALRGHPGVPEGHDGGAGTGGHCEDPRLTRPAAGRCRAARGSRGLQRCEPGPRQHVSRDAREGPHVRRVLLHLRPEGRPAARDRSPHVQGVHDLVI